MLISAIKAIQVAVGDKVFINDRFESIHTIEVSTVTSNKEQSELNNKVLLFYDTLTFSSVKGAVNLVCDFDDVLIVIGKT